MAKQEALVMDQPRDLSPANLLQIALQKDSNIDVIERLAKLQVEMRRLDAEVEFNQALSNCQNEIRTVINDAQGQKKAYATYKALDKEVRPVYLKHDFSLSFGSADCSIPEHILVTCHVSRGLHTRLYQLPMDASGKGPKGEGALSKPHAILAAAEYGRRCLLKMIFNIVTGDEDILTNGELMEQIEFIQNASDPEELKRLYKVAYERFESNPNALKAIIEARKAQAKKWA